MTIDAVTGAAAAGAERVDEFINKDAAKAEELGKEGYNAAKAYAKKGFETLKEFGVKAGEKLKPLAKDTIELGKEAVKFVKANPGKTAMIATAGFAIGAAFTKILISIFNKAPEKTTEKA